jgi:hypothetical protein
LLYHYTNGTKLELIQNDGIIKSSPEVTKLKEKPIAWLSSNAVFEKTATKIIQSVDGTKLCNMEETALYCKGIYRFGFVETELEGVLHWPRLGVQARIPESIKKRLLKRAKLAKVSPNQWYGVLDNISIENATLEAWRGGRWVLADLSAEIQHINAAGGSTVISKNGLKAIDVANENWKNI